MPPKANYTIFHKNFLFKSRIIGKYSQFLEDRLSGLPAHQSIHNCSSLLPLLDAKYLNIYKHPKLFSNNLSKAILCTFTNWRAFQKGNFWKPKNIYPFCYLRICNRFCINLSDFFFRAMWSRKFQKLSKYTATSLNQEQKFILWVNEHCYA